MMMMMDSFDTTSNTMSMILYHLANNPDIQEKARLVFSRFIVNEGTVD